MLAYMRLIIREATKFGGYGWLTYDAVFRRNQEGLSQPWNVIDPSLHIAYIASQEHNPTPPCQHCNESDHPSSSCALAPLIPLTRGSPRDFPPGKGRTTTSRGRRPSPYTQRPRLCHSWNKGRCSFPGVCAFTHVCATCEGGHPAKDCARLPPDSPFRAPLQPPPERQ